MKFGIVGNINKPKVKSVIRDFVEYLDKVGADYIFDQELREFLNLSDDSRIIPLAKFGNRCDIVVAFGGDGTILSTAAVVGAYGVPIIGVNMGGLGFLAEVVVEELQETVHNLLEGHYRILERMVFAVRLRQKDGKIRQYNALNDVVVDKGVGARLILVDVHVDDTYLNTYRSDGIIVSTPTGSTAYSLSAGGPLLVPTMQAIIVAPICPHSLTVRPIVLSGDNVLRISVIPGQNPVQINIDGQNRGSLEPGDLLEIGKADYTLKWVSTGKRDFFEILRTKLNWGVDLSALRQKEKNEKHS